MKNTILTLAIATIVAGAMITGCQSSSENTENAPDQMQQSMNDDESPMGSEMMSRDSITEYQKFKSQAKEQISSFEKDIANFKVKIDTGKEETKAAYEKKLASVEQMNNELKKKLEEYKDDGQEDWSEFKNEFNHDMDDLKVAFKDLITNKVK